MTKKKKAIVTGSNKGIGFAIAKELIRHNYEVWIAGRNPQLVKKAAEELHANYLILDVTDPASVAAAFNEYQGSNKTLDLLVNNAGVYMMGKDDEASKATLEGIRQTYDVNIFGVISVTQTFLPLIKATQGAQILNISSGMGSQGLMSDPESFIKDYPMMIGYCSSKAALNTFTILLAKELKDSGVRVNSMCPGYVDTELNGHSGVLTTDESAKAIVPFIMNSTATGQFAQANGTYPW